MDAGGEVLKLWSTGKSTNMGGHLSAAISRLTDHRLVTVEGVRDPLCAGGERYSSATDLVPESLRNNWGLLNDANLPAELGSRLQVLALLPEGWGQGDGHALTSLSVTSFLRFWRGAAVLQPATPFLTLTFSGHLQAEWHASWRRHFQIEFISPERTHVALLEGANEWLGTVEVPEVLAMAGRRRNPLKWRLPVRRSPRSPS